MIMLVKKTIFSFRFLCCPWFLLVLQTLTEVLTGQVYARHHRYEDETTYPSQVVAGVVENTSAVQCGFSREKKGRGSLGRSVILANGWMICCIWETLSDLFGPKQVRLRTRKLYWGQILKNYKEYNRRLAFARKPNWNWLKKTKIMSC